VLSLAFTTRVPWKLLGEKWSAGDGRRPGREHQGSASATLYRERVKFQLKGYSCRRMIA
jgi:hypothetical protein